MSDNKDVNDEMRKQMEHYRRALAYMGGDVPIEALCLPKPIENILIRDGRLRVYDLRDLDLTKIKGLGRDRRAILSARLYEFFTMQI